MAVQNLLPQGLSPTLVRVLPFAVYMAFIALAELGELTGLFMPTPENLSLLYPVKALCTTVALVVCLRHCPEISLRHLREGKATLLALLSGIVVFVLWINLDQPWAVIGDPVSFQHDAAPEGIPRISLIVCRFLGAAVVVPLAEELFWRSWLIRYLQARDWLAAPLAKPHLFSFLAVNVLFALEHHMVLAGFVAGAIYTALLYRTSSVTQCVLAHAVTNAALGAYVLITGNWQFW